MKTIVKETKNQIFPQQTLNHYICIRKRTKTKIDLIFLLEDLLKCWVGPNHICQLNNSYSHEIVSWLPLSLGVKIL